MSDAISVRSGSLVTVTARALADLSMAAQDGESLGSEDELLARLRVSRPTLRQAAKMVESDRLIAVRRGAKGGFYACRPNAADVIRAPARYLRLNGATIADVHAVTTVIAEMTAAAAARSEDLVLREQLAAFRDGIEANDTVGDIIRAESDLTRLLTEMSGNPVARLFLEISHTFGRNEHHLRFYQSDEDRRRRAST
jgi:DNA-binding FadR family transcriptional regulator